MSNSHEITDFRLKTFNEKFSDVEKEDIINCVDKEGWAAIHYAVNHGHIEAIKSLLESNFQAS